MRRGHAGALLDLVAGIPERHRAVGHARGHHVGPRDLAAARAEVRELVGRRRTGRPGRQEARREGGAHADGAARAARKADRRKPRAVVAGADREHHIRMRGEHRVHDAVDPRLAFELVAHAEAHVEHQRQVPGLGEGDGVVHCPEHAAGGRDAALRAVRDLEPEQLRAGCHAVEAGHAVQVVTRGDAGDVGAVSAGVEEEVELGCSDVRAEVGGDVHTGMAALGGPPEALAAHEVVVDRPLARERAVAVGIGQEHPAVGRANHDDRQRVAHDAVAVEIGRRRRAERQLGDRAGVVRSGGAECHDPPEPAEPPAGNLDRVAGRRHPRERDRALAGEVAQIEDLRGAGGGGEKPRHARVDAGVQNADQHAAAVGLGLGAKEPIHAGARERHPAVGVRHLGRCNTPHRIGGRGGR